MTEPDLLIGQTVSHYHVLAKIGEGGMGTVYRAQDLRLGRVAALKFLPAGAAVDPAARKHLLREAQAASRLNHPNIATIYEVNDSEALPFIAMELVDGESLKQLLQRGALVPGQLVNIARQVAEGLQEAHRIGVFHRDVKPGNIMVNSKLRAKILDFGLAVLVGRERVGEETVDAFLTRSSMQNAFSGTLPYMSPEQLRGEQADARSDIFSFGVTLYECLAGQRPFRGANAIEIAHSILYESHPRLCTLLPGLSVDWEQLTDWCLAKSAEQRCGSMEQVIDVLRRIAAPTLNAQKSIAVLYFANLSGSREDEYFRDGMTEDIVTELSKIKGISLFPRSAMIAFRDKQLPAAQIGQQLGAAYVLDGSIRRAGNRLRINAQLAETRTGRAAWAERYDRELEDVFEIQDEIAQNIARALRIILTEKEKREIEKVPTREVQAYDYYLRGRQYFHQLRRKTLEFARQMFARAIVIDPTYARAFAGVADCCSYLYMYFDASQDNLREAISASRRAVELDPESAEAHTSRGLAASLSKNYEQAEKEFESALRLNPELFEAYYFYGRSCFAQAQHQKAADLFEKAGAVNPDDFQSISQAAMCHESLGDHERKNEAHRFAMRRIEGHVQLHPDDVRAICFGAQSLCELGERERSLEWTERALALEPEDSSVLYNVACAYALLGESEKAVTCLEDAVRHGYNHKEWIENDSDLASIRDNPRFRALLQRFSTQPSKPDAP
jgi:serine/threonine protein kinase/Flp pilus assembly protein TadD